MADCSKTLDFVKEFRRMCHSFNECENCPFGKKYPFCKIFDEWDIDDAVIETVQKWSDEHPEPKKKTYADYFFECFPNSFKGSNGVPVVCRNQTYGLEESCKMATCKKCWNETMPDEVSGWSR